MSDPVDTPRIAQFQIKDPNAMAIGGPMMGFLECIMADSVLPILQRYHLDKIEPNNWYPFASYLQMMQEVTSTDDLVSVGMAMMNNVPWPPEVYQLPFVDVLKSINDIYKLQHRGDVGEGYIMDFVDDHHVIITIANPYPDDLIYGCYWQISKKFLPKGTEFEVYYDTAAPLRKEGGEVTKIHIVWG
ncbi:MAG TPA: hypothetical protein VHL11_06500 [Phototrophicaceae bacterium]|jgi:hypothetical protein|nr:hypothetical protein [Phototrophicaceae bacterium]